MARPLTYAPSEPFIASEADETKTMQLDTLEALRASAAAQQELANAMRVERERKTLQWQGQIDRRYALFDGPAILRRPPGKSVVRLPRRWHAYPMGDVTPLLVPDLSSSSSGVRSARPTSASRGEPFASGMLGRTLPDTVTDWGVNPGSGSYDPALAGAYVSTETEQGLGAIELGPLHVDPWYMKVESQVLYGGSTANDRRLAILQGGKYDAKARGVTVNEFVVGTGGDILGQFLGGDLTYERLFDDTASRYDKDSLRVAEIHSSPFRGARNFSIAAGKYRTRFGIEGMYDFANWQWFDAPVARTRILGSTGLNSLGVHFAYHSWDPAQADKENAKTMRSMAAGVDAAGRTVSQTNYSLNFGLKEASAGSTDDLIGFDQTVGNWTNSTTNSGLGFSNAIVTGRAALLQSWLRMPGSITHPVGCVIPGAWHNTLQIGVSGIYGPNATGNDGHTMILGADVRFVHYVFRVHQPKGVAAGGKVASKFARWWVQAEGYSRAYEADGIFDASGAELLSGRTLRDWGGYIEGFYAFDERHAIGLRAEHAGSSRKGIVAGSGMAPMELDLRDDPLRHDRLRLSLTGILRLQTGSELPKLANSNAQAVGRIRFQYSYDEATFLKGDDSHTVWIGFDTVAGGGGGS